MVLCNSCLKMKSGGMHSGGICGSCYRMWRHWNETGKTCRMCKAVIPEYKDLIKGLCVGCTQARKDGTLKANCRRCQIKLSTPSRLGLCPICKEDYVIKVWQKQKALHYNLTRADYEQIRLLIRRWNTDHFSLLDCYRATNYFLDIFVTGNKKDISESCRGLHAIWVILQKLKWVYAKDINPKIELHKKW